MRRASEGSGIFITQPGVTELSELVVRTSEISMPLRSGIELSGRMVRTVGVVSVSETELKLNELFRTIN